MFVDLAQHTTDQATDAFGGGRPEDSKPWHVAGVTSLQPSHRKTPQSHEGPSRSRPRSGTRGLPPVGPRRATPRLPGRARARRRTSASGSAEVVGGAGRASGLWASGDGDGDGDGDGGSGSVRTCEVLRVRAA